MDMSDHPLRNYRRRCKPPLTLEDLAERMDTTKATLSRIENRKLKLDGELLASAVEVTGIPASTLRPDLAKLFVAPRRARPRRTRAAA